MKAGDLVMKRYGHVDPFQQGMPGVVTGEFTTFTGRFLIVLYPNKCPTSYRADEFEVVSESR